MNVIVNQIETNEKQIILTNEIEEKINELISLFVKYRIKYRGKYNEIWLKQNALFQLEYEKLDGSKHLGFIDFDLKPNLILNRVNKQINLLQIILD